MRSRWRRIILVCLAAALAGAIALWLLTRTAPQWYAPPDPHDATIAAVADDVEYFVVEQTQRVRNEPDQSWAVQLTEAQVNAWLSARLPRWIENRGGQEWSGQLGTPQVHVEAEGMSIALPLGPHRTSRVLVARIRPTIIDGKLHVEIDNVAMGRISLPGEPLAILADKLDEIAPQIAGDPQVQSVIDVLVGRNAIDPVVRLEDGRRIRVLDIKFINSTMQVTAQTLDAP